MNLKKTIPNTSNIAHYNPFGQYIMLNKFNEKEVKEALKSNKNREILTVFSHELRHWRDHHTTIWGINNQIELYNAINARLNNDPNNFHHIPKYFKSVKKDISTEYYHTKISSFKVKQQGPYWNWKLSIGSRFNHDGTPNHSNPIQFVNFLNPNNDDILSRTPLSNASLLETNAICEEIKLIMSQILELKDIEQKIELQELASKYFRWLYDSEYTLYSVIAHITSSILKNKDITLTFSNTNEISNLLLNLPEELYQKIPINSYMSPFGDKNGLLNSQMCNGHSFLNLLFNYNCKFKNKSDFNLNDLLKASNLPNKSEIEKQILATFDTLKLKVIDGPFKKVIINKIDLAIKYFKLHGLNISNLPVSDFLNYQIPLVIFGDTMIDIETYNYPIYKNLINDGYELSLEEWYLMQEDIYKELETFYNVCGV